MSPGEIHLARFPFGDVPVVALRPQRMHTLSGTFRGKIMTYICKVLDGKVILPSDAVLPDGTTVRVEPINGNEAGSEDLRSRGIGRTRAAELRTRLGAFAEDWDSPEMDVYNNYDAAHAKL